jgi:hypothetical protein
MTVGAWVWPRMMRGITEASTTRNPSRPRTRSSPVRQLRLLAGAIVPVVAGLQELGERRRYAYLPLPVRSARFQQQDPARWVG